MSQAETHFIALMKAAGALGDSMRGGCNPMHGLANGPASAEVSPMKRAIAVAKRQAAGENSNGKRWR
jgi:hypothetical protein